MGPLINVPPDKRSENCQMNKGPLTDEYAIDNSEDELDVDNQSLRDPDEDDETSELLIRAFSPHSDKSFADEVHQVANKQGLSPRAIHHDKLQFKHQDINTTTDPYLSSSFNGGQLSTTMKHTNYYYKLHQYSFVGTFGRIVALVNTEAKRLMLVESNMQSTRTTTN
ncbi:hypothetical protein H5410_027582 [Solanum commersonii]|uniref:Uncharacterized protein n=1 Tax=Solanum commersonii TaxID=4109 RepID=A0A9J5Z093_SOLCO|nr:hypothetical protein H5410_027582 [Solanum commersonii]